MSKRKRSHDEGDADGVERKTTKRHKNDTGANMTLGGNTKHKNVPVHEHGPCHLQHRVTNSKADRKAAKRQRRKERREERADGVAEAEQRKNTEGRKKKHKEGRKRKGTSWRTSEAVGGQMLDLDPLFSPDEKLVLSSYQPVHS